MASANGSSSQVRVLLRRLYCSLSKLDLFAFPPNVPPRCRGRKTTAVPLNAPLIVIHYEDIYSRSN